MKPSKFSVVSDGSKFRIVCWVDHGAGVFFDWASMSRMSRRCYFDGYDDWGMFWNSRFFAEEAMILCQMENNPSDAFFTALQKCDPKYWFGKTSLVQLRHTR